jgi:hypothetical protein
MPGRRPHFPGGKPAAMTLVELVMSLCILTLVGAALASLCTASARSWTYSESRQNMRMTAIGGGNQVAGMLRSAKLIGVVYSDGGLATPAVTAIPATGSACVSDGVTRASNAGAACMFWMNTAATSILAGDVAVLEHDPDARQLVLWRLPSGASNANVPLHPADLDSAGDVAAFKSLPNIVRRVVVQNVTVCRFNSYAVNNSATPRLVEFFVKVQDAGGQRDEYWSITPRAAAASTAGL